MIVIGVHNRHGLKRLLGSTAHGVLNNTELPILLVHADEHETATYDNVVVALDTSPSMADVLAHAMPYIKHAQQYQIVTVVQSLATTMGSLQASARYFFSPGITIICVITGITTATTRTTASTTIGITSDAPTTMRAPRPTNAGTSTAETIFADTMIAGSRTAAGQVTDRTIAIALNSMLR